MDDKDIFDIDFLDKSLSSNKLADNLNESANKRINELRINLFNKLYDNLLKSIKNNNKYLMKKFCVYVIPDTFEGVVIYKELKRVFMKHIIMKLYKENFNIDMVNKDTIIIKW